MFVLIVTIFNVKLWWKVSLEYHMHERKLGCLIVHQFPIENEGSTDHSRLYADLNNLKLRYHINITINKQQLWQKQNFCFFGELFKLVPRQNAFLPNASKTTIQQYVSLEDQNKNWSINRLLLKKKKYTKVVSTASDLHGREYLRRFFELKICYEPDAKNSPFSQMNPCGRYFWKLCNDFLKMLFNRCTSSNRWWCVRLSFSKTFAEKFAFVHNIKLTLQAFAALKSDVNHNTAAYRIILVTLQYRTQDVEIFINRSHVSQVLYSFVILLMM